MTDTIAYDVKDGIATITLNRPESLNAFNREMRHGLNQATEQAANDESVRVVVLRGAGRAFCSGADLAEGLPADQVKGIIENEFKPALMNLATMPKPVIASVRGAAAGIGASFAFACDLTVMSDGAFFMMPFAMIGLVPDGGATMQLVRAVGQRKAYEMAIEGTRLSAQDAAEYGLANRVVLDADLETETMEWAKSLCDKAPLALACTKQVVRDVALAGLDQSISIEAEVQAGLAASEDCAEGIRAFFEKRPPVYRGR